MSPSDPLSELISALRKGTADRSIEWQQADSYGNTFLARRPSGTVTIKGKQAQLNLVGINISVTLTVKDAEGNTVEKYDAVEPNPVLGGIASAFAFTNTPDSALRSLYAEVREQVTQAESTMRKLSQEFGKRQ